MLWQEAGTLCYDFMQQAYYYTTLLATEVRIAELEQIAMEIVEIIKYSRLSL